MSTNNEQRVYFIELFDEFDGAKEKILNTITSHAKRSGDSISIIFIEKRGIGYENPDSIEYAILAELLEANYKAKRGLVKKVFIINLGCFLKIIPDEPKIIKPEVFKIDYLFVRNLADAEPNINMDYVGRVVEARSVIDLIERVI